MIVASILMFWERQFVFSRISILDKDLPYYASCWLFFKENSTTQASALPSYDTDNTSGASFSVVWRASILAVG